MRVSSLWVVPGKRLLRMSVWLTGQRSRSRSYLAARALVQFWAGAYGPLPFLFFLSSGVGIATVSLTESHAKARATPVRASAGEA